jgi:hypothetical protein
MVISLLCWLELDHSIVSLIVVVAHQNQCGTFVAELGEKLIDQLAEFDGLLG